MQIAKQSVGALNPEDLYQEMKDTFGQFRSASEAGSGEEWILRIMNSNKIQSPIRAGVAKDLAQMYADPNTRDMVMQAANAAWSELRDTEKVFDTSSGNIVSAIHQRFGITPQRQAELVNNPALATANERQHVPIVLAAANPVNYDGTGRFQMSPEVVQSYSKYLGGGDVSNAVASDIASVQDRTQAVQRAQDYENKTTFQKAMPFTAEAAQNFSDLPSDAGMMDKTLGAVGVGASAISDVGNLLGGLPMATASAMLEAPPEGDPYAPTTAQQFMAAYRSAPSEQTGSEAVGQGVGQLLNAGVAGGLRASAARMAGQSAAMDAAALGLRAGAMAADPVGTAGRVAGNVAEGVNTAIPKALSRIPRKPGPFSETVNQTMSQLADIQSMQKGVMPVDQILKKKLEQAAASTGGLATEQAKARAWLTSMEEPAFMRVMANMPRESIDALTQSAIQTLSRDQDPKSALASILLGGVIGAGLAGGVQLGKPASFVEATAPQIRKSLVGHEAVVERYLAGQIRPGDLEEIKAAIEQGVAAAGPIRKELIPIFDAEIKRQLQGARGTPGPRFRTEMGIPASPDEAFDPQAYGFTASSQFPSEVSVENVAQQLQSGAQPVTAGQWKTAMQQVEQETGPTARSGSITGTKMTVIPGIRNVNKQVHEGFSPASTATFPTTALESKTLAPAFLENGATFGQYARALQDARSTGGKQWSIPGLNTEGTVLNNLVAFDDALQAVANVESRNKLYTDFLDGIAANEAANLKGMSKALDAMLAKSTAVQRDVGGRLSPEFQAAVDDLLAAKHKARRGEIDQATINSGLLKLARAADRLAQAQAALPGMIDRRLLVRIQETMAKMIPAVGVSRATTMPETPTENRFSTTKPTK